MRVGDYEAGHFKASVVSFDTHRHKHDTCSTCIQHSGTMPEF